MATRARPSIIGVQPSLSIATSGFIRRNRVSPLHFAWRLPSEIGQRLFLRLVSTNYCLVLLGLVLPLVHPVQEVIGGMNLRGRVVAGWLLIFFVRMPLTKLGLAPPVGINVDVDDGTSTLGCDLVLSATLSGGCSWETVYVDLILMRDYHIVLWLLMEIWGEVRWILKSLLLKILLLLLLYQRWVKVLNFCWLL